MTITRAQAETELVRRAKKKMLLVSMAVTVDGTNEDLSGPLAFAARAVGLTLASPITVTTSELTGIGDDLLDEFLDRATLRLLNDIKGNLTLVDTTSGPFKESFGQLQDILEKEIKRLEEEISVSYDESGTLTAGVVGLDFQTKRDDVLP